MQALIYLFIFIDFTQTAEGEDVLYCNYFPQLSETEAWNPVELGNFDLKGEWWNK